MATSKRLLTPALSALLLTLVLTLPTSKLHAAEPPSPDARIPVDNIKPLLLQAIDAPDGRARGVLAGKIADVLTERFKGTSPIRIDVDTEKRFKQPGCSRLMVKVWQEGVLLPGATSPRRQTVEIGLNYCRDGQPPSSLE